MCWIMAFPLLRHIKTCVLDDHHYPDGLGYCQTLGKKIFKLFSRIKLLLIVFIIYYKIADLFTMYAINMIYCYREKIG
jgi:hypothetical protein